MTFSNSLNITSAGIPTFSALGARTYSTPTQYNVLIGNAGNLIANVAPSATSGVPVISQGAASNPIFGTAVVAGGGTGQVTLTNHGVLVGAATAAITQLAAGSAGQVLQSGGASADPAYSTATFPSTATGTSKILVADGTNWVASVPTFPNASATSGKFIQSDGTNWVASTPTLPTSAGTSGKILISDGTNIISSTPTFPNSASGTGTILRADGTNWVATTSTYPNTNAVNTLLYASSANVMAALATANSGVLATNGSGVPSISTTPTVTSITFGSGTALNTYAEGTWTPTITVGGGTPSYGTQYGAYTRIGRLVIASFTIGLSGITSPSGNIGIGALPFTISNLNASYSTVGTCLTSSSTYPGSYTYASISGNVNTTTVSFNVCGSAQNINGIAAANTSQNFYGTIIYFA